MSPRPGLTHNRAQLLRAMIRLGWPEVSKRQIMEQTGMEERTAHRTLRDLRTLGYLNQRFPHGERNAPALYQVTEQGRAQLSVYHVREETSPAGEEPRGDKGTEG